MNPLVVPRFEFNQPAGPDCAAFELFRAASLPHFAISLRENSDAADFYVHAVTYQLPHLVITRVRGGEMVMDRGLKHITNDPHPPLLNIHIQLQGRSEGTAGNRRIQTDPGDILFYDYASTLHCSNDAFECITLLFSRDRAHPSMLQPEAHGIIIQAESAPALLLRRMAEETHTLLERFTPQQADMALQSMIELTGRMIEEQLSLNIPGRADTSIIKAALDHIEENLNNAGLSPSSLASELGVSRSSLYRIFRQLGGVEKIIRERRLDRAMRRILTSTPINYRQARVGFNNEEQFARAFQKRFGARPGRYLEMVRLKNTQWLKEQSQRMGFESLASWIESLEQDIQT